MRVYSEEVELDGRDPEQDYLQYKESCESLASLMGEIQELKANGAKEGVRFILSFKHVTVETHNMNKVDNQFWPQLWRLTCNLSSQCAEVERRRMQGCIHFMNLKKLNRLAHMRLKRGRDQTHEVTPTQRFPTFVRY